MIIASGFGNLGKFAAPLAATKTKSRGYVEGGRVHQQKFELLGAGCCLSLSYMS